MRIFNRYIFSLVLSATLINVVLAVMKQDDLTVYFTVNVIAYLMITLLNIYFAPAARRALTGVTIVLFSGFMATLAIRSAELIFGT